MRKSILSFALVIALCLSMSAPVFAAADMDTATKMADNLYAAGLFNGTGTDANGKPIYNLEGTATRAQAITMLVRVLGKTQEAEKGNWNTPFTDVPNWAKPYVGYAYANKLTTGTGATTFGSDTLITPNQYLTFLLTALGYDKTVDFKWDNPYKLAAKLGLIKDNEWENSDTFKRSDMVATSYNALLAYSKSSTKTLADKLGVGQYIVPIEEKESISSGWNGVGVNANKQFDPENPLAGMPNTQAVVDKYDLGYGADLVSLAVNFVGLRNNMGADTMVLEGFSYSSVDQDRYETCIALLKDILDTESANAFIKWIEELDKLNSKNGETRRAYGRDSAEYKASREALLAHGNKLWEASSPVEFGNVLVSYKEDGNVMSFVITNK